MAERRTRQPGESAPVNVSRDRTPAPASAPTERARQTVAQMCKAAGTRANGWTLRSYLVAGDYQRSVVDMVAEWSNGFAERRDAGEGLVLVGPVGTGKDHLAFGAVAAVVLACDVSAAWIACRDLFGAARDRIGGDGDERRFVRDLTTPDLLILSDPCPPVGDLTPWQADLLFRVTDERWRARRPTVVTANVADDDEADRRIGAPTWDRLTDRAWRAVTRWPSFRRPVRNIQPMGDK